MGLSTTLYHKRFFPYYTFNVLCGLDSKGEGAVYHYDAIGSMERNPYTTSGSGSDQVMSVLDSQLSQSNQTIKNPEGQGRSDQLAEGCDHVGRRARHLYR